MHIFTDLDGTLYNTGDALNGDTVYHILTAELHAPLFDNAKAVLEDFTKQGHICIVLTARGLIDDEEVGITKSKLKDDGLIWCEGKECLIYGMIDHCSIKYSGIKHFYTNYYNKSVDKANSIFIDDDIRQVINVASNGIQSVLFTPEGVEINRKVLKEINRLNIKIAKSWLEFKEIVDASNLAKLPKSEEQD